MRPELNPSLVYNTRLILVLEYGPLSLGFLWTFLPIRHPPPFPQAELNFFFEPAEAGRLPESVVGPSRVPRCAPR